MKCRYIVFDVYDVAYGEPITHDEIIGRANTIQQVRKIEKQQIEDTDGECYIMVFDKVDKKFVEI